MGRMKEIYTLLNDIVFLKMEYMGLEHNPNDEDEERMEQLDEDCKDLVKELIAACTKDRGNGA